MARLLDDWARALDLSSRDRRRWRAAGILHDALRDAPPDELPGSARLPDWPGPLLHAPACAERLRDEGVGDGPLLLAISHHPVGHPEFGPLGDHLYLADYLEPGREFARERRRKLRHRMPGDRDTVLVSVVAARIEHLLERRSFLVPESVHYWNSRVD